MRPVFNQAFKNNMELSLYQHSLLKLYNSLALIDKKIRESISNTSLTAVHVVTDSDSLRTIAIKYYNDVNIWRQLGVYNKVDASTLVAGMTIQIPERQILNGLST